MQEPDHVDPSDADAEDGPPQLSRTPLLVALVLVATVIVAAAVFLRADDEGELLRPDRLTAVDDDRIRAVALEQPSCVVLRRAQVDLGQSTIYVELVVSDLEPTCPDPDADLIVDITLPEPIDDRRLIAGVGRLQLPCEARGSSVECGPGR